MHVGVNLFSAFDSVYQRENRTHVTLNPTSATPNGTEGTAPMQNQSCRQKTPTIDQLQPPNFDTSHLPHRGGALSAPALRHVRSPAPRPTPSIRMAQTISSHPTKVYWTC
ncbi:hypothetical protein RYX36_025932 [Vicia faba]